MKPSVAINNPTLLDATYDLGTTRLGMWIFIAMETLFFGGALFLYSSERHFYPDAFAIGSSHLELGIAAANTAVLLTSSLTMVLAGHFLEKGKPRTAVILLAITAALGAGFLALKGYEYVLDWQHGTIVGFFYHPNFAAPKETVLFFSLYLLLTGLHAIHLTIGVIWCSVVALGIARLKAPKARSWHAPIEVLGLYWHFVDIVWIFLLPLFYLVGGTK
jgi:cytochrome c oxidase subunit 3